MLEFFNDMVICSQLHCISLMVKTEQKFSTKNTNFWIDLNTNTPGTEIKETAHTDFHAYICICLPHDITNNISLMYVH